jgi:hypothetical protein
MYYLLKNKAFWLRGQQLVGNCSASQTFTLLAALFAL